MAKNKFINLLPQEEFEASTTGRTLRWAMTSFRVIVIATEIFVMAGFLSRFWLDKQRSDLDESIKVKTAQISAQKDFETEFRGIQRKLSIAKDMSAEPKDSDRISGIALKVPADVFLTSIALADTNGHVKGTSTSELGIAQFMANLRANSSFKEISLSSIRSSDVNPFVSDFDININY